MSNQYKFDETTGKWLESGAILSGVNSVNGLAGDITLLPVGIVTTTTGDVSPPVYAKVYTGDTAPATPVTGDIWIDSTYGSGTSNILRWRKLAGGGETSLSGTDATGQLLVYTPGYEQLYINGVLQYRGSDYVATTGTTITGISALAASDTIEVVAPSATQFGDYYTQAQSDARFSGPAFSAWNSTITTIGNTPATVKIGFQTEEFDTNNNYDTTLSRFTPTVAGYYQINALITLATTTGLFTPMVYKNGVEHKFGGTALASAINFPRSNISVLVYANGTTDYFEIFAGHSQAATVNTYNVQNQTYFQATYVRRA
jgi:hypothetical protein